jgi:hypothetical protein
MIDAECVYVCTHVCLYARMCVIYVCMTLLVDAFDSATAVTLQAVPRRYLCLIFDVCVYIYIHTHTHTHIYIYIRTCIYSYLMYICKYNHEILL